jgi:hypothetical protein
MVASTVPASIAEFSAWLWVPGARLRARGFGTVRLTVLPNRLIVTPRFRSEVLNYVLGVPPRVEYTSGAVVLDRVRPLGLSQMLLEVNGGLGAVTVRFLAYRRLQRALSAAGFAVVGRIRWGWETPRPVEPEILGALFDEVPSVIVKR